MKRCFNGAELWELGIESRTTPRSRRYRRFNGAELWELGIGLSRSLLMCYLRTLQWGRALGARNRGGWPAVRRMMIGFNGAELWELGIDRVGVRGWFTPHGFNGAELWELGIAQRGGERMGKVGLQWGRALGARNRGTLNGIDVFFSSASMGPSFGSSE